MKTSIGDLVVDLATHRFDFFHDEAGVAWAWDGALAVRVGSEGLTDRVARDVYRSTDRAPGPATLTTAMTTLRARALWDGSACPVGLRIAAHDGQVVVGLAG